MVDVNIDLQGADEIASFLKLSGRRQVYKILEYKKVGKTNIPIWTEPGLGIVSSSALLRRHIELQSGIMDGPTPK